MSRVQWELNRGQTLFRLEVGMMGLNEIDGLGEDVTFECQQTIVRVCRLGNARSLCFGAAADLGRRWEWCFCSREKRKKFAEGDR